MKKYLARNGGGKHVPEYEQFKDGRLVLGTPCFSGARLKKRFETQAEALEWRSTNPGAKNQKTYQCHMCKGWHLTTKAKRGKSTGQRRSKGTHSRSA